MAKKTKYLFKSYLLQHHSNPGKVDALFKLYSVYQSQFKYLIHSYWNLFLNNKVKNNTFSHLGSTKHIQTKLNSAYTQICLSQVFFYKTKYRSHILDKIKLDFVKEINPLLMNGVIGRRTLYHLLKSNDYYSNDMKIASTTKAQGVEPMTVLNYDKYLTKYYEYLK